MIQYDISGSSLGSAYTTALKATSRQWDWYIRLAVEDSSSETVIASGDQVISIDLYKGACGNAMTPGSIFAPYFEAELSGYTFSGSLVGTKVNIIAGLYTDSSTVQYINEGFFVVTEAKEKNGSWTLKGSSYMSDFLSKTYTPSGSATSSSLSWYLDDLAVQMGYSGSYFPQTSGAARMISTETLAGLTYQEALGLLSSLLGLHVTDTVYRVSAASMQNRLAFVPFISGNLLSVGPTRSATPPEYEEDPYEVTGVTCIVTADQEDPEGTIIPGDTYTQGTPVNITFGNSLMTSSSWEICYPRLVGKTFEIGTVELTLGDPRLESIDQLRVTDMAGTVHTVPCFNIHHHYDGGLATTVSVPIDTDATDSVTLLGPVEQAVKTLKRQVKNLQVAGTNAQYFWHNESDQTISTGSYITEIPEAQFRADPDNGGGNLLARSNGIALRNGTDELATFTQTAVTIGKGSESHMSLSATALEKYGYENGAEVLQMQIGDALVGSYEKTSIEQIVTATTSDEAWTYTFPEAPLEGMLFYVNFTTVDMLRYPSGTGLGPYGPVTAIFTGGTPGSWGDAGSATPSNYFAMEYDGDRTLKVWVQVTTPPTTIHWVMAATSTTLGASYTLGKRTSNHLSGGNSLVVGTGYAQAQYGVAIGEGIESWQPNQFVIGKYNALDASGLHDYAFIIGNGEGGSDGNTNALTVETDGHLSLIQKWGTGQNDPAFSVTDGLSDSVAANWRGNITLAGATSTSHVYQRDNAAINTGGQGASDNGMITAVDMKSRNGDWGLGTVGDAVRLAYVTDTNYNAGTNTLGAYLEIVPGTFRINDGSGNLDIGHTYTTSTAANIVTASGKATVSAASFAQWGKLAQVAITFTLKAAISVDASGNCTDTTLGTLVAGKRPAVASPGNGIGAPVPFYSLTSAGNIILVAADAKGTSYSLAKGTNLTLRATYLLA